MTTTLLAPPQDEPPAGPPSLADRIRALETLAENHALIDDDVIAAIRAGIVDSSWPEHGEAVFTDLLDAYTAYDLLSRAGATTTDLRPIRLAVRRNLWTLVHDARIEPCEVCLDGPDPTEEVGSATSHGRCIAHRVEQIQTQIPRWLVVVMR